MTDFPNISVLCPTYNRPHFLPLLIRNMKAQDYPHKNLELVIDDDGDIPFIHSDSWDEVVQALKPIKLKLLRYKRRRTIGEKRNNLVKNSSNKIVAFMDDDDIYMKTYLTHSFETLMKKNMGCVGCNKMIFLYSPYTNDDFYFLTCGDNKIQIHECNMMMTKKWFNSTNKFAKASRAEGGHLFSNCNLKKVELTEPHLTMIQLCHNDNTINKEQFKENKLEDFKVNEEFSEFIRNIMNLSKVSGIKPQKKTI